MKKRGVGFLWLLLLVVLAGVGYYFWQQGRKDRQEAPSPSASAEMAPAQPGEPAPPAPPAIRFPLPESGSGVTSESLPKLDESDASVEKGLSALGGEALLKILRNENIVRNIVVTVDNLPRKVVAQRLLPVKPAEGRLATQKSSKGIAIADDNFKRYAPFVSLLDQLDVAGTVAVYTDLYPLFQTAYRDLGYPEGYFNDRLVDVIDHMLAAPEPEGPILIRQPHILYQYADPTLENSSAGHKLMVRMGKDNAQRVKEKLRQFRQELTKGKAQ